MHEDAPQNRRNGRPPLPPEDRRDQAVDVRLSPTEAKSITERAARVGMRLREFIRHAALNTRIVAPPNRITLGYAHHLVQLGETFRRLERLALAGRLVGMPAAEIDALRRHIEAAAVAVLAPAEMDADEPRCSP